MCQNSFLERSEQIERCVEHGMPEKIVKSVIYTLKKRIKRAEKSTLQTQETTNVTKASPVDSNLSTRLYLPSDNKIQNPLRVEDSIEESSTTKPEIKIESFSNNFKIPKMCGRFRQQSVNKDQIPTTTKTTTQSTDKSFEEEIEKPYVDVLSVGTAYTKLFFEHLCRTAESIKQTKIYALLTKTTQPAHFIAICILSVVLLTIWPDLIDSSASFSTTAPATTTTTTTSTPTSTTKSTKAGNTTLAAIAYLGAFATHFGAQIWMTFVSGLSLYFSLPRHTFGQCQQILFPKYFTLNSVLSIILLVIFVKCFLYTWSLANTVQFATLVMNPVIELTVRLYLAPPMLRLMHEKYKIEDAVGSGQEVGSIVQGDLTQCPHYQRVHKAFRRLHMMVAIGNMTILMATCLQLYFLASKIQIQTT